MTDGAKCFRRGRIGAGTLIRCDCVSNEINGEHAAGSWVRAPQQNFA